MKRQYKKVLKDYPIHESQRGYFGLALYKLMAENEKVVLVTADLGFKLFDKHFTSFPDRCFNVGAAEQSAIGVACGLSLSGKIPVVYSITPFLLYRPFETLRTYVSHEEIPMVLAGSGRDLDYKEDGISHHADDAKKVLAALPNIISYWPKDKESVEGLLQMAVKSKKPGFISLRR